MNNSHQTTRYSPGLRASILVLRTIIWTVPIAAVVLAQGGPGPQASPGPSVFLKEAPPLQMPGVNVPERKLPHESDCNSPVHWDGDTLFVFNSYSHPWRSSGPDLFHLGDRVLTRLGEVNDRLWLWIESTWKDEDTGNLYGAYHYEPDVVCVA